MKAVLWIVTALLLALWTLGLWAAAALVRWAGQLALQGDVVDAVAAAGGIRLPAWLTWWIDPTWLAAALDAMLQVLQTAQSAAPWLPQVAGWLVALLWLLWGVGTVALLGLAALVHWIVGRKPASVPAPTRA